MEKDNSSEFAMEIFTGAMLERQTTNEILSCNDVTSAYGLSLTYEQAVTLAKTKSETLKSTGRVEFKSGIIEKIIYEFCNSQYISPDNYEDVLNALVEIFYSFKNDTSDMVGDDELIEVMKKEFNGNCAGSLDLLAGKALPKYARELNNRMYGIPDDEEEVIDDESSAQQ